MMSNLIGKFLRKAKISFETNDIIGRIFKFFLNSPLWYYPSIFFIRLQARKKESHVKTIMIETTNRCNSRCIMCPMSFMKRKKGIMSRKLFNLVLERIKESHLRIKMVWVSGFGEPFLDPDIFSRIKILKNLGYRVKLSTNASLLDEKNGKSLLDSGIDEVNISFNGANKSDYEKIMLPLNYNLAVKNITRLFYLRKKMGLKKPILRISSILLDESSQAVDSLKRWEKLADSVSVAKFHEWGGVLKSTDLRKNFGKYFWPCLSLWDSLYIAWNGDVFPCCVDYEGRMKLGNLKDRPIHEILSGPALSEIRNKHLISKFDGLPAVCRGCDVPFRPGLDWFLPFV